MTSPSQVGHWIGGDCEGLLVFGPKSECSLLPENRNERHDKVPWPQEVRVHIALVRSAVGVLDREESGDALHCF